MSHTRDYLRLHFIVWIWGFTAILGALISIPAVEIVFYRTLFAFLALGIILFFRNKRLLRIPGKAALPILGTGIIIGAHWILFFGAARMANVSVCLVGMATCSLWTSFLEPFFNKKKVRIFEVVLGIFGIVGLFIIFQFNFQYKWGITMAIVSAFLSALFSVFNGKFTKKYNAFSITLYEMFGAWMATLLFLPFYRYFLTKDGLHFAGSPMDWIYLLILSLICTVFAFSESVILMKRLSAFIVNLTVNLEPVYGIILALILFPEREQMPANFYLGTSFILLSVLLYPLLNRYYKNKPLELDNLR